MIRTLINMFSFHQLTLLLVSVFICTTLLASVISHKFFTHETDARHYYLTNNFMNILTGGYYIFLAFIIINLWTYLLDAQETAIKESNSMAEFIYSSRAFPSDEAKKMQDALKDYLISVRDGEWKSMVQGEVYHPAFVNLNNLFNVVQAYQPKTTRESAYYTLLLNSLNSMLDQRRSRIHNLESIIPRPLIYSLLLSCFLLAFILGILRGTDRLINLTPMLVFSALLGFNAALVMNFDYPYSGSIAVSNSMYFTGVLGTLK